MSKFHLTLQPWYGFLIFVIILRSILQLLAGFHPVDDAYITFRYALNIINGNGFVFNTGEHVLGTTTPLWTLILVGFGWLGCSIPLTAMVLSVLSDAVSALVLTILLKQLGFSHIVAVLSAILFLGQIDGSGRNETRLQKTCHYGKLGWSN